MWASHLHNVVHGQASRSVSFVGAQNTWVSDEASVLTDRKFIQCIKARINALPARNRTFQQRSHLERGCRARCTAAVETPNHTAQQCFNTHGARIKKHNVIVSYILRDLEQRRFEGTLKPIYRLDLDVVKPDIVSKKFGITYFSSVLDAKVVEDSVDLRIIHTVKTTKYSEQNFSLAVKTFTEASEVYVSSATLNW